MIELKGDAKIGTKEIPVSSFLRIHVLAAGTVEMIQSEEEKVVLEADENLIPYIEVSNSGRTLYISAESSFRKLSFSSCRIKIFLRQVDTICISHAQASVCSETGISSSFPLDIKVQEASQFSMPLYCPSVAILHQAVGPVCLTGKCQYLSVKVLGEGNFDARHLQAEELQAKITSDCDVKLHAERQLEITQLGDGTVHYSGPAVLRDLNQRGDGIVRHL